MNRNGPSAVMPETDNPAGQTTMTELVSGIVSDAQTLIKQQFAMLRAEIKDDINRTAEASKFIGIGASLLGVGAFFLMVAVVYLLNWLVPDLPVWACWAIVGGITAVAGAVIFFTGRQKLSTVSAVPEKSINALQENLSWIANRQS